MAWIDKFWFLNTSSGPMELPWVRNIQGSLNREKCTTTEGQKNQSALKAVLKVLILILLFQRQKSSTKEERQQYRQRVRNKDRQMVRAERRKQSRGSTTPE